MTAAFGSIKTHEPEFYKGVTSRERTIYRPRRRGSKGNPPKKGRGRNYESSPQCSDRAFNVF